MATIEEIRQELTKADVRLDEATKNLKTFEEGEDDGKWLKKLRKKLRTLNSEIRREKDEEKKKILEGDSKDLEEEINKLEEEKKRLVKDKDDRWKQMVFLQKELTKFGGGEGNKQIA